MCVQARVATMSLLSDLVARAARVAGDHLFDMQINLVAFPLTAFLVILGLKLII